MKKNCIITGASTGLGAKLVKDLIAGEYNVLTMQRNPPIAHPNVHWIKADFADIAFAWKDPLGDWLEKYGSIDLLINNAAKYINGPFNDSQVRSILSINLISPIVLTNIVIEIMVAGSLVMNINSVAGIYGMEFEPIYSASKHGLKGFSKSLRLQLADKKINVCDIHPGGMNTELWNSGNPYPGEDVNSAMDPAKISNFLMFVISSSHREMFKEFTLYPIQEKFA